LVDYVASGTKYQKKYVWYVGDIKKKAEHKRDWEGHLDARDYLFVKPRLTVDIYRNTSLKRPRVLNKLEFREIIKKLELPKGIGYLWFFEKQRAEAQEIYERIVEGYKTFKVAPEIIETLTGIEELLIKEINKAGATNFHYLLDKTPLSRKALKRKLAGLALLGLIRIAKAPIYRRPPDYRPPQTRGISRLEQNLFKEKHWEKAFAAIHGDIIYVEGNDDVAIRLTRIGEDIEKIIEMSGPLKQSDLRKLLGIEDGLIYYHLRGLERVEEIGRVKHTGPAKKVLHVDLDEVRSVNAWYDENSPEQGRMAFLFTDASFHPGRRKLLNAIDLVKKLESKVKFKDRLSRLLLGGLCLYNPKEAVKLIQAIENDSFNTKKVGSMRVCFKASGKVPVMTLRER